MKLARDLVAATQEEESVDFFLLANLSPKQTGLPFVVWISPRAGAQHDVRVMVSRGLRVTGLELLSVAIRPKVHVTGRGHISVQDLALLQQWVDLNGDVIVKYWDGDIECTADALAELKPIQQRRSLMQ